MLTPGESHDVPFKVGFTAANLVCPQEAKVIVAVEVKDKNGPLRGVMGHAKTPEVEFTIPAGTYSGLAVGGAPFNSSQDNTLTVMLTPEAPDDHLHQFEVLATYAGGLPSGCQGTGAPPSSTDAKVHEVHIMAEGGTSGGDPMSGMDHDSSTKEDPAVADAEGGRPASPPAPEETNSVPAFDVAGLLLVALLAAVLVARRR
ncbi:MAG TPA: hypothetical protein VNZ52_07645 [Candidatus Thermoplasmatota archaeon]|nr:hypothetical protein [Candidatus Thermoplasmatota archaeon]